MWEWWFGWHNTESACYELWFPTTNCGSRRPPVRGARERTAARTGP
ncbi:hypothetical protein [Streptomyces sp. NPDC086182]